VWLAVLLALVLWTAARGEAQGNGLIVSWTQGPTEVYPGDEGTFVVHAYRWPQKEDLGLSPLQRLGRMARAYQPDWAWLVTVTLVLPEGWQVTEAEAPKLGWTRAFVGSTVPITEKRWPIRCREKVAKYLPWEEEEGRIKVPLGVVKPGDHTIIVLKGQYWPKEKCKPKPVEDEGGRPYLGPQVAGK